jgi:conjugative transfer signal peptidase TraF
MVARKNLLIFNSTPSVPIGIWKLTPIDAEAIGKINLLGKTIAFCPSNTDLQFHDLFVNRLYIHTNQSYFCKNGFAPLIKTVRAISGDEIGITSLNEIIINKNVFKNLIVAKLDSKGRPLPQFKSEVVPLAHYWVAGDHPSSLDSRYFGSIDSKAIIGFVLPALILPIR